MIFDALGRLALGQGVQGSDVNTSITGVAGTGQVGSVTPKVSAFVTGVAGTGQVGSVSLAGQVTITGVSATGQVGTVTPKVAVTITSVSCTGQVGTVGPTQTVTITGMSATGQVGSVAMDLKAYIAGVAAQGLVGQLFPNNTGGGIYIQQSYSDFLKDNLAREDKLAAQRRQDVTDTQDIKRLARKALRGIKEYPNAPDPETDTIEILLLSL